jgi:hypothetical protein
MDALTDRTVSLAFDDYKDTTRSTEVLLGGIVAVMAGVVLLGFLGDATHLDLFRIAMGGWAIGALALTRAVFRARRFRRKVGYRLTITPAELSIERTPDGGTAVQTRLPRGFPGLRFERRSMNQGDRVAVYPRIRLADGRLVFEALDRPVTDELSGETEGLSQWLAAWWLERTADPLAG